jgi:hypothetical protein
MQRMEVRVPISQPFVCPECSSPLRAPSRISRQTARAWPLQVNLLILAAGIAASGVGGFMIGRQMPAIQGAARPRVASIAPAASPSPGQPAVRQSLPAGLTTGTGAAALPAPLVVAERPYPSHASAVEKIDPPPKMQAEVQSGQVVIDCMLGSAVFHPACKVSHVRGTDAFSEAAMAWLQKLPVRYVTGPRGVAPVALDHRWRVVFDDFNSPPPDPGGAAIRIVTPKKH